MPYQAVLKKQGYQTRKPGQMHMLQQHHALRPLFVDSVNNDIPSHNALPWQPCRLLDHDELCVPNCRTLKISSYLQSFTFHQIVKNKLYINRNFQKFAKIRKCANLASSTAVDLSCLCRIYIGAW